MHKEIAEKWIKALRSGKYKQTQGALHRTTNGQDYYCCLGVLCDLLMPDYNYLTGGVLPPEVLELSGVRDNVGIYHKNQDSLIVLNDSENKSFKYIANVIEKHWRDL